MSFLVAGVDIGSLCTKTVIMSTDKKILSFNITRSGAIYRGAAESSLGEAMKMLNLNLKDLKYIVSTGYGRARVPFANAEITEITCHGRGANYFFPEARTVIDIGGQDSKVIRVNETGQAIRFVMNDKCAAGTGRFLEVMAGALGVDLEEMSEIALHAHEDLEVSSTCTVFAESEIISLLAGGYEKGEIAAAIYKAIARRITGLVGQIGLVEKVAMTGGVAKSSGVVRALENKLSTTLLISSEPQIVGACGAALIARERALA